MPWGERQEHRTSTGGLIFAWVDIGDAWKPGGPHGGRFEQGPEGLWWKRNAFRTFKPWVEVGINSSGIIDRRTALMIQAYGERPVRTGTQASSEVSAAQKRWDKDKELLISLELPAGLESRFARVADGTRQGPGTLRPLSDLLLEMEDIADAVGLEDPTYIKRTFVGTSRKDPLDFAKEGVEYIARFNNPDFGGPVNFRVYKLLFTLNVMIAHWQDDLEKDGIIHSGKQIFEIVPVD